MQEFNKLLVAGMLAVAVGLILLAVVLGVAACRAHRNAQLAASQLVAILFSLFALLVVPALLLILRFPRPS